MKINNDDDLNIVYICSKTLLDENDELVPIILDIIKESYKAGLCQAEHDNTMDLIEENQELKEQLEKRKYYKFYKYKNNPNGSDYCFCERPCDSNMSLKCFFENGEICGFMSETLVVNHDNIEEISLNEFAHDFIKPLINANFQNKNQQKEFIKYLEDMLDDENDIFSVIRVKDVLQKYKEIIGDYKE